MIVKPDDQILDYYSYQKKIGIAERDRHYLQVLQVLDRRSRS